MRSLLVSLSVLAFAASLSAAPVPLFDGKSFEGWEGDTQKTWRIQEGAIVGGSLTEKVPRNEFLATKKSFKNFDLKVKFKLVGTEGFVNSGVQFRSVRIPKPPNEMRGYQADLGDPKWWGCIYDESRRNKVMAQSDMSKIEPVLKRQDWNDYRIRAVGPRVQVWINGVQTVDYTEEDASIPQEGHIAVQIHRGGVAEAWFKEIEIEELPDAAADPKPAAAASRDNGPPKPIDREKPPGNVNKSSSAKTPATSAGVPVKRPGGRDLSYNAADAGALTSEEERASFRLPEGFVAELVADESVMGKAVAFNFDNAGRMWVTTANEYPLDANEQPEAAERLYREGGTDAVLIFETPWAPGLQKPRVFAGTPASAESTPSTKSIRLAMPMGVLPYKDGAIVQHGPDLLFLRDTDGDGTADAKEVLLTGFGIQDSHLMPHGFTRGPGDWIYFAQGAFNTSHVKTKEGPVVTAKHCKLMRMKPDGSRFEIVGWGLNNIWGFVIDPRGEMWVQEANDLGYPVAPFQLGMAYPGIGSDKPKPYAPFMPKPRTLNDCSMGGTGLSGLALNEDPETWPAPWTGAFMIANPITNKIQAIRVHREDTRDQPHTKDTKTAKGEAERKLLPLQESPSRSYDDVVLKKLPDFLVSDDKCFRPVTIQFGPDGSLYVIDWYNKIISHNEVPRSHPERDKTRSRIWRIRSTKDSSSISSSASSSPTLRVASNGREVPDLTSKTPNQLVEYLSSKNQWQSNAARFELIDRPRSIQFGTLEARLHDETRPLAERIGYLWALNARGDLVHSNELYRNEHRILEAALTAGVEQQWAHLFGPISVLWKDFPSQLRPALANAVSRTINRHEDSLAMLAALAHPLDPRGAQGSFERYLLRSTFETWSELSNTIIRTWDEVSLRGMLITSYLPERPSDEVLALICVAAGGERAAVRLTDLLSKLKRTPDSEELALLGRHLSNAKVRDALIGLIKGTEHQQTVLQAVASLPPIKDSALLDAIASTTRASLRKSKDPERLRIAAQLVRQHQIAALEPEIANLLAAPKLDVKTQMEALRTLSVLGSGRVELFQRIATAAGGTKETEELRREAVAALASVSGPEALKRLTEMWPQLPSGLRKLSLDRLSSSKVHAAELVRVVEQDVSISIEDLDDATLEKLTIVLGEDHAELASLLNSIGGGMQPVLRLNGDKSDVIETRLDLKGPFTVEAWVRLDDGISNEDVLLGSPSGPNFNFYDGRLRIYAAGTTHDALVARTKMRPDVWTHVAITRDGHGRFQIFLNGELDAKGGKPWPNAFDKMDIGRNSLSKGPSMALMELRVWQTRRTTEEIRDYYQRSLRDEPAPSTLQFAFLGARTGQGKELQLLGHSNPSIAAKFIARSRDVPQLLTGTEARALDAKFARYQVLTAQPGDATAGATAFASACGACHKVKGVGGQIGPDLSGAGAMGTEALLRNILTPNAQLESGYYRYDVELKNGDLVSGFLVKEEPQNLTVRPLAAEDRTISRNEIRRTRVSRTSLMPEGLFDGMTDQAVRDLFAYLRTLK